MKRTISLCSILLLLLAHESAHAKPRLVVEPSAPFTEAELQAAVDIRGGNKHPVQVHRRGDAIVVHIGDEERVVDLVDSEPTNAARVVAIVIIGLDDASPTPRPSSLSVRDNDDAPVLLPAAPPRISRLGMRASIAAMRDDGGRVSPSFAGAISYAITPAVRLVGSVFVGQIAGYRGDAKHVSPMRLGVEGRAGALGLEFGAQVAPERDCAGGAHSGAGAYGVARIYVPMDRAKGSFVVEAGAYYVEDQVAGCADSMPVSYDSQAGYFGLGVEWPL